MARSRGPFDGSIVEHRVDQNLLRHRRSRVAGGDGYPGGDAASTAVAHDRDPRLVQAKRVGLFYEPSQRGVAVVDESRAKVFRGQPVVHGQEVNTRRLHIGGERFNGSPLSWAVRIAWTISTGCRVALEATSRAVRSSPVSADADASALVVSDRAGAQSRLGVAVRAVRGAACVVAEVALGDLRAAEGQLCNSPQVIHTCASNVARLLRIVRRITRPSQRDHSSRRHYQS